MSWNVVKPRLISNSANRMQLLRMPEKLPVTENFESLQVQVAIEHGYEMLSWGYQDVVRPSLKDTVGWNSHEDYEGLLIRLPATGLILQKTNYHY